MKISNEKKEKISEQILAILYSISPKSLFTFQIAKEIARDEEFVKELLMDLKKQNFIVDIRKNPKGISYLKRVRWKMSDEAYSAYKKHQDSEHP